jgi:two-component system sensor histidine kinase YesM
MRKQSFTAKLIYRYTLIVAVPFFLMIVVGTELLQRHDIYKVVSDAQSEIDGYCKTLDSHIDLFYKIQSTVAGNSHITTFLGDYSELTIEQMRNKVVSLTEQIERIVFLSPDVYSIRVFTTNPAIPERWPILFSESHLDPDFKDKKWVFNYKAEYLGNLDQLKKPSALFTTELLSNNRHTGYLQVAMEMDKIFPFLYENNVKKTRNFLFYGDVPVYPRRNPAADTILDSRTVSLVQAELQKFPAAATGKKMILTSGGNKMFVWEKMPSTGFFLIHECAIDAVLNKIVVFRVISFIAMAAIGLLVYSYVKGTTSLMMSRLYTIMDGLREVRKGNFNVTVPVLGTDEVAETAAAFNKTTANLRELILKIKQEQNLLTETKVKAMQNQINAHFLYNVLETIKMQAELADQENIVESVTLLGKMMRYCLRWRLSRVTLEEELEYIQSYITILNIRNDYKIELVLDIPDEYRYCEILKMLIQPVVENAFFYGIEPQGVDAVLKITAQEEKKNGILWLKIQDYGNGMTADELEKVMEYVNSGTDPIHNAPGKIGLRNIQERLHVFYGKEFNIEIRSKKEAGTEVCIPIPYTGGTPQ